MKWYKGIKVAKDPDAVKSWFWDWTDWLSGGDAITNHSVAADDGLAVDASQIDGSGVIVLLSGGVDGSSYGVTVEITTSSGLTDQRTVTFEVSEQ